MKFVLDSTLLLSHLQAISRVINSKNSLPILDDFLLNIKGIKPQHNSTPEFHFDDKYRDYNFLLKLLVPKDEKLIISQFEKKQDFVFKKHNVKIKSAVSYLTESLTNKQTRILDFKTFTIGSVKELMRRLALYTGQIQSTLFRVLRNTRIHSLSIFFGLCCSRSGYIFEAITGTSSHPIPASL